MSTDYQMTAAGYYVFKELFFGFNKQKLTTLIEFLTLMESSSGLIEVAQSYLEQPEELEIEYNRMCVGPTRLVAPPYQSVYLGNRRQMFTEITDSVLLCYQEIGLKENNSRGEPADFFGNELEFLYAIYTKLHHQESDVRELQVLASKFLHEHIGKWYQNFLADIRNGTKMEFWQLFADELEAYIATSLQQSPHLVLTD